MELVRSLRTVLEKYNIQTEWPYGSHECSMRLDGVAIEYAPEDETWLLEIPSEAITPRLNGVEVSLPPAFRVKLSVAYCPFCGCYLDEPVAHMLAKASPELQEEIAAEMRAKMPEACGKIATWFKELRASNGQQG